jgi:hypothetical protein
MLKRNKVAIATISLIAVQIALPATAQDLFIYPSQGQSQEQQNRDQFECHQWAVQNTGFDPTRSQTATTTTQAPPPSSEPAQGGLLRGGARGAAVGAVGGAIAGDAGKGAAIGAASGAMIGGMRRRDQVRRQEHEQQQWEQQQAQAQASASAAYDQQRGAYNRAMAACLQGRGYTVN